jgi:predicted phage terminase large subunit-like protein
LSTETLKKLALAAKRLEILEERERQAGPGGLMAFVRYFWSILEPNQAFVEGWAIRAIAEHLEAVHFGHINRLLINVPPGFMKSLLTNCFFPAWEWSAMDRADLRYLSFSYAAHLTRRDNRKLINLLKSQRFIELWGRERGFELVKEGEELVGNSKTGWKFATSVGGVGTGERGSRLILDDPHAVRETESDPIRTSTVRWFRETMSNRLNNETDPIIVIMQRIHEDDVAGNIIADDEGLGYTQLRIPMEYVEDDPCSRPTKIGWEDPRTTTGELAWPDRYSSSFLRQFKIIPFTWASQYQQDPEPRGGAIILRDWWRLWESPESKQCTLCGSYEVVKIQSQDPISRWHSCNECNKHFLARPERFPVCSYILASLDTSYTESERNDPSAMTVWGIFQHPKTKEPGIILMDAWRKWLRMNSEPTPRLQDENEFDFKERTKPKWGLVEWTVHTCRRFKADCLLIENKASGITLQQELQIQYGREMWSTIMKQPEGDKEARAHSVTGIFANGLVWAANRDYATLMIEEAAKFPFGKFRDLTDSMTQALRHIRNLGLIQFEEERLAEMAEEDRYRPKLQPLYPV